MSSNITEIAVGWPQSDAFYIECEKWNEGSIQSTIARPRENVSYLSIHSVFICFATILTIFFAVSLILTLTSQYFLDWGSALVGLLGSLGLALVGWFSKNQIKS